MPYLAFRVVYLQGRLYTHEHTLGFALFTTALLAGPSKPQQRGIQGCELRSFTLKIDFSRGVFYSHTA